jgi:ATP diphosphatase
MANITDKNCVLLSAQSIQLEAKQLGFDWPNALPVFDKVAEELGEVREAVAIKQAADVEEEIGDLLFAVVNLARHLDVCPQKALAMAKQKFSQRFDKVKSLAEHRNIDMNMANIDVLEALWTEIKQR